MMNVNTASPGIPIPLVPGLQLEVGPMEQALVLVRFTGALAKRVDVFFADTVQTLINCDQANDYAFLVIDNPQIAPRILALQPSCSKQKCHMPLQPVPLGIFLAYESLAPMRHWLLANDSSDLTDTISITIIVQPGVIVGIPGGPGHGHVPFGHPKPGTAHK